MNIEDFVSQSLQDQQKLIHDSPDNAIVLINELSTPTLLFDVRVGLAKTLPVFFSHLIIDVDRSWLDRILECINIFYGSKVEQHEAKAITASDLEFVADILPIRIFNGIAAVSLKADFVIKRLATLPVVSWATIPNPKQSFFLRGQSQTLPQDVYLKTRDGSGRVVFFLMDKNLLQQAFSKKNSMDLFNNWLVSKIANQQISDIDNLSSIYFYSGFLPSVDRDNFLVRIEGRLAKNVIIYNVAAISRVSKDEILAFVSSRVRKQIDGKTLFELIQMAKNRDHVLIVEKELQKDPSIISMLENVYISDLLLNYTYQHYQAVISRLWTLLQQADVYQNLSKLNIGQIVTVPLLDVKINENRQKFTFVFLREESGKISLIGYY